MHSNRTRLALGDIRDNILATRKFLTDLTFDEFIDSQIHFYAVMRALEIISEASRRLPESFHDNHPKIPWSQITGLGNVYRHAYHAVRYDLVWETATKHLEIASSSGGPRTREMMSLHVRLEPSSPTQVAWMRHVGAATIMDP